MKVKYRKKVTCVICGTVAKPQTVESEILLPMRGSANIQFIVTGGKCGHTFKMSQEEMGVQFRMELMRESLWVKMKKILMNS